MRGQSDLGSRPSAAIFPLDDLDQVTSPLWASVSLSVNWKGRQNPLGKAFLRTKPLAQTCLVQGEQSAPAGITVTAQ